MFYVSCSECGAAVLRGQFDTHVCDPEKRLDHQVGKMRGEFAHIEHEIATWLQTPQGQFAAYYAERTH